MKYITFILGLLCCGLLNGQIKPHLEQIPKNKASKYQLEDLQLNESALPALPLNPDMAVFKPRYNYSAIRSLAKPAMVGKQLKVITSPKTGIPVLIKGNLNYPMQTFAGKSNLENECLSFLDAAKEILQVEQVDQAFAFTAVNPGAEGWQHVRIQQQVEGIPI